MDYQWKMGREVSQEVLSWEVNPRSADPQTPSAAAEA
jgi:hypothetical protein